MRIAAHVPKDGAYYPGVRAWMARLGQTALDQRAYSTMITEIDARRLIERICPNVKIDVRRMRRAMGRADRRKISLNRRAFERGGMPLGTVLHECVHTLVRRREYAECLPRSSPHGEIFCRTYANLLRKELPMIPDVLKPGHVIRHDGSLWRVEHVNHSRAYILPLTKHKDGTFSTQERGVSIAATSYVEVINDLERALTELELREAERELRKAREALEEREELESQLAAAEREIAAARAEAGEAGIVMPRVAAPSGRGGTTWQLAPGKHVYITGSLKAAVVAFLTANPGATTKEVATAMPATPGATAACLDRFWKAGVVIKN